MSGGVGYRRPPPDKQFKKGTSGNPKGRPKGSGNFVTLLEQELAVPVVVNENGKKKKITRLQAMVKKLVGGALGGDQKTMLLLVEVMRRTGKLSQIEPESLLPDDYEDIVAKFVLRPKSGA